MLFTLRFGFDAPSVREYIQFIYSIYRGNSAFRDLQVHLVQHIMTQSDSFLKCCSLFPCAVTDQSGTAAQALLIYHPAFDAVQIACFEAREGVHEAVQMIRDQAIKMAKQFEVKKITVGLNGHVSYGVGMLADNFDTPISFDSQYSPPWYPAYFSRMSRLELNSYRFNLNELPMLKKTKLKTDSRFAIRPMNMRKFRDEVELFGRICNETLAETCWYFDREPLSMYELLKEIRFLLKPEYLLFLMDEDQAVGAVFWHPDFAEVIPGGRKVSMVEMGIRMFFGKSSITGCKVNYIGITAPFRKKTAYRALLTEALRYASARYSWAESNFVWKSNRASIAPILHLGGEQFRTWYAWEEEFL